MGCHVGISSNVNVYIWTSVNYLSVMFSGVGISGTCFGLNNVWLKCPRLNSIICLHEIFCKTTRFFKLLGALARLRRGCNWILCVPSVTQMSSLDHLYQHAICIETAHAEWSVRNKYTINVSWNTFRCYRKQNHLVSWGKFQRGFIKIKFDGFKAPCS